MNNIRTYQEYITERKNDKKIITNLCRHLAYDKEIISYLNSPPSKREEGWRELLNRKLHGSELDYINYLTKNRISEYNPKITGYVSLGNDDRIELDKSISTTANDMTMGEIVNDISVRLTDIEDVLGINPDDNETIDKVVNKLKEVGYEPDWIEKDTDEEE